MPTYARRRKRLYPTSKLTRPQVRAAWTLYAVGWSVGRIAAAGWDVWGYASEETCRSALYGLLRREGYELRAKQDATRLANHARARGLGEAVAA